MSQQGTTPPSYPPKARASSGDGDGAKRDATLIERISGNNSRDQTYIKSKDDIPFPAPSPSASAFTNPWRRPSPSPSSPSRNRNLPPNPAPNPAPRDSPSLSSWRSFLNIYDNNTSPPLTPVPTSSPVIFPTSSSSPSSYPASAAGAGAHGYEVLSIPALGRRLTEAEEEGHLECLGAQRGCWKTPSMRAKEDKEEEVKDGEDGEDGDDTPVEEKDDPFSSVPLERGALGSLGVSGEGYEDDGHEDEEAGSESGSGSASESEEAESEAVYEKEEDDDKDKSKKEEEEGEDDDDAEELINFAPRRPPLTPKVSSFNHTNRYRYFGHINCPAFPRPPPASPRKQRPVPERAFSVPAMLGAGAGGYGARVPSKLSGSVVAGAGGDPNPDHPQPFPQPTPHPPPRRANTFSIAPCFNGLKQGHGARTLIIQNKADDETGLAFGMLKVVEQRRGGWAPVKQPERWVLRGELRRTESRVPTLGSLKKGSGHGHGHGHGGHHHHHHEHGNKLVQGQS
ncbi:hypothetical protein B9479_005504 [Cryptococcus floricola]|uniref:Uncharacterized protein n=1 Tax=Cryptococcus floricola TaxID=2591691 RepID=A0A5D3AST3_9TREE|nr:hypothetical protein B9479_005504 [Cryptococcus floricola]